MTKHLWHRSRRRSLRTVPAASAGPLLSFKDGISIGISLLALIVSATTAYFTLVVKYDDLRIVIGESPIFTVYDGALNVDGDQKLTFINSGNRMLAITSVFGLATKLDNPRAQLPECNNKAAYKIPFQIEPFVLKGGDIEPKTLQLLQDVFQIAWNKTEHGTLVLDKKFFQPNEGETYLACIGLTIATPDNFLASVEKPVFTYLLTSPARTEKEQRSHLTDTSKPLVIFQRSTSPFRWLQ